MMLAECLLCIVQLWTGPILTSPTRIRSLFFCVFRGVFFFFLSFLLFLKAQKFQTYNHKGPCVKNLAISMLSSLLSCPFLSSLFRSSPPLCLRTNLPLYPFTPPCICICQLQMLSSGSGNGNICEHAEITSAWSPGYVGTKIKGPHSGTIKSLFGALVARALLLPVESFLQ